MNEHLSYNIKFLLTLLKSWFYLIYLDYPQAILEVFSQQHEYT